MVRMGLYAGDLLVGKGERSIANGLVTVKGTEERGRREGGVLFGGNGPVDGTEKHKVQQKKGQTIKRSNSGQQGCLGGENTRTPRWGGSREDRRKKKKAGVPLGTVGGVKRLSSLKRTNAIGGSCKKKG